MITKIGTYEIQGVEWVNPILIPMQEQPILIYGLWSGVPKITIPIKVSTPNASRALNLENIPIDKIEFDVENPQDVSVLIGRISAKFDQDYKKEI